MKDKVKDYIELRAIEYLVHKMRTECKCGQPLEHEVPKTSQIDLWEWQTVVKSICRKCRISFIHQLTYTPEITPGYGFSHISGVKYRVVKN